MTNKYNLCTGRAAGLLLVCLTWVSCTLIKENRTACPCALTVEVRDLPAWPVRFSLSGEGYYREWEVPRDTSFMVRVPQGDLQLTAVAGAPLPGNGRIAIPYGYDCPSLYAHSERVSIPAEEARVRIQLHKHYCTLSLEIDSPPGWGEPYWTQVRGKVGALAPDGTPEEGAFQCRLDSGDAVRLPRQYPDGELWLDLTTPDGTVRSFALGNYMLDAGYDWTAPDLEDLPLQLDLSLTAITFRTGMWAQVIPLEIEI